jgi:hypothetical protein
MALKDLRNDERYLALPQGERYKVLERLAKDDSAFMGLPDAEKSKVLNHLVNYQDGTAQTKPNVNKPIAEPSAPIIPDTPEQVSQKLAKAKAGLGGNELNFGEKIAQAVLPKDGFSDEIVYKAHNIASGATSLNRGIGNLIAGEGTFKAPLSPNGNQVDKESMAYLAGQVLDPTSWALMGGMSKIPVIGKAIQPITGSGKIGKIASNIGVGTAQGGVLGGLSEDSTLAEGAAFGGVLGGLLPVGVAGVKATGRGIGNVLDTIGASFGNKGSVSRMSKMAIDNVVGGSRDKISNALAKAKLDEINKVGATTIPNYKQTVSEVLAKPQIGKPDQFGGGVIRLQKDLTGAGGVEDALTGTARSQVSALKDFKKATNQITTPLREDALNAVNKNGGVDVSKLTQEIDVMRNEPDISKLAKKTLKDIKKNILDKSVNGKINGKALYTTRKEIGNTITTHSKSTQNWDKQVTGKLERDIQKKIDDAIETSGGVGWNDYLKTHSTGMKKIADAISGQKEAKLIASGVKPMLPNAKLDGEIPQLPSLLSRPMMAVNYGLKLASKDATKPIEKEVVRALQNPDVFSAYLKQKSISPSSEKARKLIYNTLINVGSRQGEQ